MPRITVAADVGLSYNNNAPTVLLSYDTLKRESLPSTSHRPLGELATEQAIHYGCHDAITFRLPKSLGVCLRTQALVNQCETSSVIRVLLQEALENRQIDWRMP